MQSENDAVKLRLFPILLLIAVSIIAYGNTLWNGFVYDDLYVVLDSKIITSLSYLPQLFTQNYFAWTVELSYRPVATFTYMIDFALWGRSAFGFHLTNLLLHILVVIALFFLIRELVRNHNAALFAALLFAVHPATTEAVNGISFREDLLATLCVMVSLICYIQWTRYTSRRWKWALLCAIFFILGLFSKETAAILPILLVACETVRIHRAEEQMLFPQKKKSARMRPGTLFWGCLAVFTGYLIVRFVLMVPEDRVPPRSFSSPLAGLMNFPRFFLLYLSKILIPIRFSVVYSFKPILNPIQILVIFSWVFMCVYLFMLYYCWKRNRWICFGLVWILAGLLPVSNVIPISKPFADRFLYFPLVGFALIVGEIGRLILSSPVLQHYRTQRMALLLYILVGVSLMTITIQRNLVWGSEDLLWRSAYEKFPNSTDALNGMALSELKKEGGDLHLAITWLERAVSIDPDDSKLRDNLGVAYVRTGARKRALEQFLTAYKLDPKNRRANYNLAVWYAHHPDEPDFVKASMHMQRAEHYGYTIPKQLRNKIEEGLISTDL